MKQTAYALLCIVLLGVIIKFGPGLLQELGDESSKHIEEQVGIPIMASWREATGPGKVLILDYLHMSHPMTINVLIKRPSTGEQKSLDLEFNNDDYRQREIGWMEGWSFQLGDTVLLTSGNYKAKSFVLK